VLLIGKASRKEASFMQVGTRHLLTQALSLQGGFALSELDRTLIRRENELKVLRNVSSHFHKAVNDAPVKNKYNKKLLSLKAEKVLHNNHQASKSRGFNLEVRDALQRAPAPNTPSASTSVTQKDAVVRLSAAEQVISEVSLVDRSHNHVKSFESVVMPICCRHS
jgi:hypothetical protein